MSFMVSVEISVAEADTKLVHVVRGETVLPATPAQSEDDSANYQTAADTAGLCQMVLDRLLGETQETAQEQIIQLRGDLERLAGGDG